MPIFQMVSYRLKDLTGGIGASYIDEAKTTFEKTVDKRMSCEHWDIDPALS
ncbi:MAG: hypothetical protein QOH05_2647 [Acetobacteraceae bacterium]|jgi:hypothetical protein|nr:hypothetical protein [Acetobacteraceae bacterium]